MTKTLGDVIKDSLRINEIMANDQKADDLQAGGNHYKDLAIQPWHLMEDVLTREEFIGYLKGNLIKYGVTMMRDDLTSLQWLNHLQEELMDATLYLERLRVKLESIEISKDDEEDLHFKLSEQGYFEQLNNDE